LFDVFEEEMEAVEMNFPTEDWIENKPSPALDSDFVSGKLNHICSNFSSNLSVSVEGGKKVLGLESTKPVYASKGEVRTCV
jgi:hypothetical protein